MTVLPLTYGELSAQNFPWVTGATGRSWGDGTTIDTAGNAVVVGCHRPDGNVEFSDVSATPLLSQPGTDPFFSNAYVVKYSQVGNPLISSHIKPWNGVGCSISAPANDTWAALKKVVVTPEDEIYAIGEFYGCGLEIFSNSIPPVQIAPGNTLDVHRVFVIHYDAGLDYVSCHIFTPAGQCATTVSSQPRYATAADLTLGIQDLGSGLFVGANFCGDSVLVDHFGAASPPLGNLAGMPINVGMNKQFQIYVGQINYSNDQLVDAVEIGGEWDDLASELSSGYLYGGTDVFLAGTFQNSISFFRKSNNTITTYNSYGPSDAFAVRFDNMDLREQSPVVAGGFAEDQALSLSDDGLMVGGFITDTAIFNGHGTININPVSTTLSTPRCEAFIAIPDYNNNDWEWATTIQNGPPIDNCFNSVVNELAGSCDEVYAVFTRGMRIGSGGFMNLPEAAYNSPFLPEQGNAGTLTQAMAYSRLEKWHHQGTTASMIWQYDLLNNTPISLDCIGGGTYNFSTNNRKVQLIEDIEVRNETYYPKREDVMLTGWFGTKIEINNHPWVTNNVYPGILTHDQNGMFLLAMDEEPDVQIDSIDLCITAEPDTISTNFSPTVQNGASWNLPNLNASYSGTGVVDPISGVFSAFAAGVGTHIITYSYEYFGCPRQDTVAVYTVSEGAYPRQPETIGVEWAEGLAAAGVAPGQLNISLTDTNLGWDVNLLAGRYFDEITFYRGDGTPIVLSSPGNESGYIVAYDVCGAIWALDVNGTGADYIEHLLIGEKFVSGDQFLPKLYAAGGFEGGLTLEHYNSPTPSIGFTPDTAVNYTTGYINIPANTQKGIVMEIEPLTGEVNWVYVGSDNPNHENSFHGMTHAFGYLVVGGDRSDPFQYNSNTVGLLAGAEDPFFVVMDDNGIVQNTSIGTVGFGTTGIDHGDAVSMLRQSDTLFIAFVGELAMGGVTQNFQDTFGNLVNVNNDMFIARYEYAISSNTITEDAIKVYAGAGQGRVHDVLMVAADDLTPFGSNAIFFCGAFENEFDLFLAGGQTMNTGNGLGDYDIYIGCVDPALSDQWFTHEGTDFGFSEAARSLELKGTSLYVYGERQFASGTVTSDFYNSSGASIGSGVFSTFAPTNPNVGQANIFTASFSPTGAYIDGIRTLGVGPGISNGNDLTLVDTSFVNAGSMSMNQLSQLQFLDPSLTVQNTLIQNSLSSDSYLGRTFGFQLGSFKQDEDLHNPIFNQTFYTIYPNPTNGIVSVYFDGLRSGKVLVKDGLGQEISELNFSKTKMITIEIAGAAGLYFLELRTPSHLSIKKVIKY